MSKDKSLIPAVLLYLDDIIKRMPRHTIREEHIYQDLKQLKKLIEEGEK